MPTRADVTIVSSVITANFIGGGVNNLIQTPSGVLYFVYCDAGSDIAFVKSADNGLTWGNPTIVYAGTVTALAVWYDRWSNVASGKIHCAYTDSAVDDILYRSIDTENSDALGVQATVFAGGTTAAGGALSITRARGSIIMVAGSIDAGAEDGGWCSTDGGSTWTGSTTDPSEAATQDQYLLLPGWNADTEDLQLIFWDADQNQISVKRYDASGDTYVEELFTTSDMVDTPAATSFRSFDAAVDIANSRNVVIGWTAVDLANADLRCYLVDDTTSSRVTDVVLDSADDQTLCALSIDTLTGYWYVFYAGKSDGSETVGTNVSICCKVSKDSGTTWGNELVLTTKAADNNIKALYSPPRFSSAFGAPPPVAWYDDQTVDVIRCNVPLPTSRRATYLAGI